MTAGAPCALRDAISVVWGITSRANRFGRWLVLALLLLAGGLEAQARIVMGSVDDSQDRAYLTEIVVQIRNAAGQIVGTARVRPDGTFGISVPSPGGNRLRLLRIGYVPVEIAIDAYADTVRLGALDAPAMRAERTR